jgi:hypothetical protein
MSISSQPLGYCTNVHPGRSVAEVLDGLDRYTVAVQQRLGHPIAAGLWLAQPVVTELLQRSGGPQWFAEQLQRRNLLCYTLNAFPFGDFHSTRVKENVYQPDWSTVERLEYTKSCATVLAALLPPNGESYSPSPGIPGEGWGGGGTEEPPPYPPPEYRERGKERSDGHFILMVRGRSHRFRL